VSRRDGRTASPRVIAFANRQEKRHKGFSDVFEDAGFRCSLVMSVVTLSAKFHGTRFTIVLVFEVRSGVIANLLDES
jgi:hypothetical protein